MARLASNATAADFVRGVVRIARSGFALSMVHQSAKGRQSSAIGARGIAEAPGTTECICIRLARAQNERGRETLINLGPS
jgi:hypothetical protein